jgi:pimeloyl-ACP methyl ester carboxylesterase
LAKLLAVAVHEYKRIGLWRWLDLTASTGHMSPSVKAEVKADITGTAKGVLLFLHPGAMSADVWQPRLQTSADLSHAVLPDRPR